MYSCHCSAGKQELESSRELRLAWEKRRNLVRASLGYLSACLQNNNSKSQTSVLVLELVASQGLLSGFL